MKRDIILFLARIMTIVTFSFAFPGCLSIFEDDLIIDENNDGENNGEREPSADGRKVLLLYSAGFNSISDYLQEDINELKQGWLPGNMSKDDIVLVYTHKPYKYGDYSTNTTPYLIRLYCDKKGKVVSDTLKTFSETSISASASQLNKVLTYTKENFPASSYGMIFSSHATGYLPAGFYSNPDEYVYRQMSIRPMGMEDIPSPVPYVEPEHDPSMPAVRTIGQDQTGSYGNFMSYEINLKDFAEAIPMKLDYIIFDACLMGGIEVAYQLAGKCGKLGFSQAEVLGDGLNYKALPKHLLDNETPDTQAVCEEYFIQYDIQSGVYQSATISLVDCDRLDALAQLCNELFSTYRQQFAQINPSKVQRFFRGSKHWFYDLESIIAEAGVSEADMARLHSALDECVIYKAHTPQFMQEFSINTFSGFSMYLPCNGNTELDKYYKTLEWNKATGLVE